MAYNFTGSGSGSYQIKAHNLFYYVNHSKAVVPIHANAEAHTASISGVLAVARTSASTRKASFNGCSSTQQTALKSAASAAQSYVAGSLGYMKFRLR
jgi:peptidyl-Lys metalloendopeptidase